jgi:hypothetical protein
MGWENKMQITAKKDNEEFHEFINVLAEKKINGEVTFFIQNGKVEGCRISQRHTKSEVKAMLEERRKAKPKVLAAVKGA